MRTNTFIKALAFAMLLTTACNKNEIANEENTEKKGFALPVTVNVTRDGDDATKATFNESTRKLEFSAGDKLFVEGRDNDGAEYFAGVLDYVPATGKFSGTIYTQNEWLGTADELFVAANADQTPYVPTFIATLLPDGYEDYGYLGINDKGDAYAYNDRVKDNRNYTLATSKAAGVEQLSWEQATVYDNGFALEPRNAILNFTVTGLEANTDVDVLVRRSTTWYIGTKTIRTDNDGKVTFVACYPYGNNLQDCTVTVGGTAITVVSSEKNVQRGKIYNITRAKPTAVEWIFSEMSEEHPDLHHDGGYNYKGVTLSGYGDLDLGHGTLYAMGDGLTFTAPSNNHFKKIVITSTYANISGSGWTNGGEPYNWTSTWTGDASSVSFTGNAEAVTSIVFTLK